LGKDGELSLGARAIGTSGRRNEVGIDVGKRILREVANGHRRLRIGLLEFTNDTSRDLDYKAPVLYEPGTPLVIEYAEAAPLGSSEMYLDKGRHALPFDDREPHAVPVVLPAAERPPRSSGRQRR
jgi:hypothetical protein